MRRHRRRRRPGRSRGHDRRRRVRLRWPQCHRQVVLRSEVAGVRPRIAPRTASRSSSGSRNGGRTSSVGAVAQNPLRSAAKRLTTGQPGSRLVVSLPRPNRPPLCVAQRGALLHHVAPGHGARRVNRLRRLRLGASGGVVVGLSTTHGHQQRWHVRYGRRSRRHAYAMRASAVGHHAPECAARLGPVKAFRADCRRASTPHGAHGLDRPFGRAGTWLLRDGPPTSDLGDVDCGLEPHELDAVVAFVRILLEWDDRARRMKTQTANPGAADDDRDERIEPRGVVCAGVK
jgi:hypothetical protein